MAMSWVDGVDEWARGLVLGERAGEVWAAWVVEEEIWVVWPREDGRVWEESERVCAGLTAREAMESWVESEWERERRVGCE